MQNTTQDTAKKPQNLFNMSAPFSMSGESYESALGTVTQHYMAMVEAATARYFTTLNAYLDAVQKLVTAQETSVRDWLSGAELYQLSRLIQPEPTAVKDAAPRSAKQPQTISSTAKTIRVD